MQQYEVMAAGAVAPAAWAPRRPLTGVIFSSSAAGGDVQNAGFTAEQAHPEAGGLTCHLTD